MKNLLTSLAVCAALLVCSAAQAEGPSTMSKLGFGGMKKVSNSAGMKVRGKGVGGYTLTPFVVNSSHEVITQISSQKAVSLDLSFNAASANSFFHGAKSEFTFIGPKLPASYGNYGGSLGKSYGGSFGGGFSHGGKSY